MKKLLTIFILLPFFSFSQNWEWTKTEGGANDDRGYSICTDGIGNCFALVDSSGQQAKILKYNSIGNIVWNRNIFIGYAKSIVTDNTGHLYVSGDSSFQKIIVKCDTSGNVIWKINAGAGNGNGISLDNSGHLYLTGSTTFLEKYDTSGNQIWVRNVNATGNSICTDNVGNSYITGIFGGTTSFGTHTLTALGGQDIFLAKYDSTGFCVWAKRAGGNFTCCYSNDCGYTVTTDNLGHIYFTGSIVDTVDFDSFTLIASSNDIFLAKYDTSGNAVWVKQATGWSDQEGRCIALDNVGNILIGGSYVPNANFNGNVLTGWGNYDAFVAKYDSNGNFINALKGGGAAWNEYVYGISIDNLGNTFVTGGYSSNSYFGADTIALIGYYDIFVSKINLITGIDELENNSFNVNIYPNPFNNEINISVNDNGKSQIILYDIASRKLLQQTFTNTTTINTEQLAKGMYLYQVRNENGTIKNGKIIKQ